MNEHTFVSWLSIDTSKPVKFADLPHLIAHALHPGETEDELMRYGVARINLEEELPKAVERGDLVVRNPAGLGVHSFPHGDSLRRAVVLPQDLAPFLSMRGIGLRPSWHERATDAANDMRATHVGEEVAAISATARGKAMLAVSPPPSPPTILRSSGGPAATKYEIRQPDWERWRRLNVVRLWEAACLAANVEPPDREIWMEDQLISLPRAFHEVWEVINADFELGKLEELPYSGRMLWQVYLPNFARWAADKGLLIPGELRGIDRQGSPPLDDGVTHGDREREPSSGDWNVKKPSRYQGYSWPLFNFLKSEKSAGRPMPTAREVLDAFKRDRPPEIIEVLTDSIKYYDSNGNGKVADLNAIRKTIQRMTNSAVDSPE